MQSPMHEDRKEELDEKLGIKPERMEKLNQLSFDALNSEGTDVDLIGRIANLETLKKVEIAYMCFTLGMFVEYKNPTNPEVVNHYAKEKMDDNNS